jgi:prophage maintenance system killer protein
MILRQSYELMEELTIEMVIEIHNRIMVEKRGDCRILSEANLHQLVFRANLVPEIVPRAALVFYALCAYPAFREGNEGTAQAVSELVLASGGYRIPRQNAVFNALAERIAAFTTEPEDVEQWFCNNVQKSGI